MASSKIGRFEILSEVAHSEQSSVYRATDTATNRPVALKAFNLALAGEDRPQLVKRLIQEAESTRNLSHQNIVLLYGAGEIDGRFCVATEYVEGFSVAANIAKGERYTVWDMLDISRQACNGLDHAHNHGVVHRRMQPANILVQWDGTVKILGFGVAGMWSEEDSIGVLSPASYYASPEQVLGQSLHTRSNLFSWGAILYEMATGKKPFDGTDVETLRQQIINITPVSPSELNPKVPAALSALILKAMSKTPTDRFATGRELLGVLETCKEAPKQATTLKAAAKVVSVPAIPKPAPASPNPEAAQPAAASSPFAAKLERTSNGETTDDESFDDDMLLLDASGEAPKPKPLKAAAAAAGVQATQSAAPAPAAPKFNVDPMISGGPMSGGAMSGGASGEAAAPARSFADSELPPMSAPAPDQFAPSAPPPETTVPDPTTPSVTLFTAPVEEKKKFQLPQIESKLLVHGLLGGLAIILLVVALIYIYVSVHTSDDEGTATPPAAAKPVETASTPNPAPLSAAPVQQEASAPAEATEERSSSSPRSKAPKRKESVAQPAAAAVGTVAVDSTPQGAQIQVDGRFDSTWVTPFTVSQLAPGQHSIVVSKAGYAAETRALNIASGSKNNLAVHLNPLTAMVSVTSNPTGASILIDGRDTGKATPAQITLEKGSHVVLVRKGGYLDEAMTAEGQPGQTIGFAPNLRPLGSTDEIKSVGKFKKMFGGKDATAGMGSVAIRTMPKGAQISVNQRILDHLSPAEILLNPGNYVVDITAPGCKPLHRIITVEKNGKVAIDESLEKE